MEGCGKCMKWLMFIFNFLFFLCGGALLGIGIWVRVDGESFMSLVGTNAIVFNAVYILIAVGAALLVISFLGCCGAMKENKCLLGTFFAVVLIIFIAEIVGGILAFVFLPEATAAIYGSINAYTPTNASVPGSVLDQAWDTTQAGLGCCGFNSSRNWEDLNPNYPDSSNRALVPDSCCVRDRFSLTGMINNETACRSRTSGAFYGEGCEQFIQNYFWIIGGIGLGILAIELLAMIFACCLYRSVDKGY